MFSIGTLTGYLRLEDTQYAQALKRNAAATSSFAKSAAATFARVAGPAALAAGVTAATRASIALAEAVKTGAAETGLALTEYQALDYILRKNGANGNALTTTITALRKALSDAARGSETARANFKGIGLSWTDLVRLSPAELLLVVAQATRRTEQSTRAFSSAAALLGTENLPKLRAGLRELADRGFPAVEKAAREAGQVMTEETVKRLENAQRQIDNVQRKFTILAGETAGGISMIADGANKFLDFEDQLQRLVKLEKDLNEVRNGSGAVAASAEAALRRERLALIREAGNLSENTFFLRDDRAIIAIERIREFREEYVKTGQVSKRTAAELATIYEKLTAIRVEQAKVETAAAEITAKAMRRAPAFGRSGSISGDLLDKATAAQRKREMKNLAEALESQGDIARQALDAFERGIAFQAANDPWTAFSEKLRAASAALKTGVVDATAYGNALRDAARAFGSAQLDRLEQKGSLLGTAGFTRREGEIQRALARARRSAAQGNYGDAQDQIDRINELDPTRGLALDEALGRSAMPTAQKLAAANDAKAKSLETQVESLVLQLKGIADKITVS